MVFNARVLSVRTGKVGVLAHGRREVPSAIEKAKRDGPVPVGTLGLAGDEQGDPKVHGGPDKALCVYPAEHFPWWSGHTGLPFGPGAFGENLTVEGLLEENVCLGDVFRIGSALTQVTQPRRPCFKIAARHGVKDLPVVMQNNGLTGFYLRVLEPGELSAGDVPKLEERTAEAATVRTVNRVMNVDKKDLDAARDLLGRPHLPEKWRAKLLARLDGVQDSDAARLRGL